jgi:hypothetical protein
MPRKPLKWDINAWNPKDSFNGYILNFSFIEREKKPKTKMYCWGEKLYKNMKDSITMSVLITFLLQ